MLFPPKPPFAVGLAIVAVALGVGCASAQNIGPVGETMFDRIDANHDNVVSKDEIQAARGRMFDRLDSNRDGFMTAAEIETARSRATSRRAQRFARAAELRAQMLPPSERLAQLDQNRDGKTSREEFVTGESPLFDRASTDGRGLSRDEFVAFLNRAR